MSKVLELYSKPSNPGAFSGLSGFIKNNKDINKDIAEKELKGSIAYTLHKPRRVYYKRRQTLVAGIDSQWQVDLIEIQSIAGSNFGMRYIFTCIDVFSKKAWAVLLKTKESKNCMLALKDIIETSKQKPKNLYLDNGKIMQNL